MLTPSLKTLTSKKICFHNKLWVAVTSYHIYTNLKEIALASTMQTLGIIRVGYSSYKHDHFFYIWLVT